MAIQYSVPDWIVRRWLDERRCQEAENRAKETRDARAGGSRVTTANDFGKTPRGTRTLGATIQGATSKSRAGRSPGQALQKSDAFAKDCSPCRTPPRTMS